MNFLGLVNLVMFLGMMKVPDQFIKSHQCLPVSQISCLVDTLFVCPPGFYDGCLTAETTYHTCLPATHGASCSLPMKLNCPPNFEDGCLRGLTKFHQCFPVKGSLCSDNKIFRCPFGFEDLCRQ